MQPKLTDWGHFMSSFDDRQRSVTNGLQIPGLVNQLSPVEQMPFPENGPSPVRRTRLLEYNSAPGVTGVLPDPASSPGITGSLADLATSPRVTRILPDAQTGALPATSASGTTTALRQPIVIRGNGKKGPRTVRPPKGRRWVISTSVAFLLVVITFGTALAVSPLGSGNGHWFNPLQLVTNLVHNGSSSPNLVAQQATATAIVHQDGYDPNSGGGAPIITGGGSLNRFAFGQCTYWANMRYHQLTGYWVSWLGNAYQWAYGARAAGWIVSSKPKVPSIIVLAPYVQGASGFGHVAIVEKINPDGSVYTSNYNWYANGGWDTLSYWTFSPGSGVSFVWHP
jgi:surface antigen